MPKERDIFVSVLSSSIGNILEWYEYTLYAYFSTVISHLFFPADDPFVSMILTFSTFAVGLAARPLGGIIFGYIGDRYSRKKMLTITILLMSIPTLCMGLLPTFQQIGILAPVLLVLLRVVQGVALGGEFGASCVYLFESAPQNRRGFYGTLPLTGVGTGLILSACTIFFVESWVTKEQLYSYAWRIPFFISVFGSFLGFFMRKSLLETPDFLVEQQNKNFVRNPFAELMRHHKASLAGLFAIFVTTQISFFVVFIFGKTMMTEFLHYDSHKAGIYNLLTLVSYTLATLVFGYISDRSNRRGMILIGATGIFFTILPFIKGLQAGNNGAVLITSLLLGAFIGLTEGTLNSIVAETFPTNIRATSVAFSWNCTAICFGGIAPMTSMWLIQKTGSTSSVAYYLMAACMITIGTTSYHLFRAKAKNLMDLRPASA